jgi:hypothetical protein
MATMHSDFSPLVDAVGFRFNGGIPVDNIVSIGSLDAATWFEAPKEPAKLPLASMILLDIEPVIPRVAHRVPNVRTTITSAPDQDGFLIGGTRL